MTQKKNPLFSKTFDVTLPSGMKVTVTVAHTEETIERKLKVQYAVRQIVPDYIVPTMRVLRDKNGEEITTPVPVKGLRVTVVYPDGTKVESRSCCKPPDTFKTKAGIRKALARMYKLDSGVVLNKFRTKRQIAVLNERLVEVTEGLRTAANKELKDSLLQEQKNLRELVGHGNEIRNLAVKQRLSGEDRSALYKACIRLGKEYKPSIKKVSGDKQSKKNVI